MTEIETINGWTFEETIQTAENLMEVEKNVFKWDVLRHLRDFAESFKDELEQYRAIGTIEEFKALKEKNEPKKDNNDDGRCKSCGTYNNFIISRLANPKGHPVIHCWNCGQAIDWQ